MKKILSIIFSNEHPVGECQPLIKEVVTTIVSDSAFPTFEINESDVVVQTRVMERIGLRALSDQNALEKIVVDSISLFETKTGYTLMDRITDASQAHHSVKLALKIRDALGMVALLWRIHHHPETLNEKATPC